MGIHRSICEDFPKDKISGIVINDFFIPKKDIKKFYDTYNSFLAQDVSEFEAMTDTYDTTLLDVIKENRDMSTVISIFSYFAVLGMRYLSQNENELSYLDDDCGQKEFDFE